nr:apoptosis regulator BAX-like isoform X2 [Hydra vulgaris]
MNKDYFHKNFAHTLSAFKRLILKNLLLIIKFTGVKFFSWNSRINKNILGVNKDFQEMKDPMMARFMNECCEINNNNSPDYNYINYDANDTVEQDFLRSIEDDTEKHRGFIRKLANDHIHYKLFGKGTINICDTDIKMNPFEKKLTTTVVTLRRVSSELEDMHIDFFENVCHAINEENAGEVFNEVSQKVLTDDNLNWGRVVSLITFGGKLAQWFWARQPNNELIEEIEDWLTESLSDKKDWIKQKGGWDDFNRTFTKPAQNTWWKTSLWVGLSASLAAAFVMKSLR